MLAQRIAIALVGLLTATAPVWAQEAPEVPKGQAWVKLVVAGLMLVAIIAAGIMTSKRGHQD